jgi:hypothetical protein
VRALRRDHIKVAHKDPRNSSLKENLLKTASNPMKKILKNTSENPEKEERRR